jgi:hypothetical protein
MVVNTPKKYLSKEEQQQAIAMGCYAARANGTFPHGAVKKIVRHFGVSMRTFQRLWKERSLHDSEA